MDAVCLQCGYKGWDNAFRYCAICRDPRFAVHQYCLDVIPKTFEPVRWVCEDCEPRKQISVTYETEDRDLSENLEAPSDSMVVSTVNYFSEDGPYDVSFDLDKCAELSNTSFSTESRKVTEQDDIISTDETHRYQLIDMEKAKHANLLDDVSSEENMSLTPQKQNGTVVVNEEGHVSEASPQKISNSLADFVKCAESASMIFPTGSADVIDKDAAVAAADKISSEQLKSKNASAADASSQTLEKENAVADKISCPVHQKENENDETDKRLEKISPLNVSADQISSQALENENSMANEISCPVHQKESESEATGKRLEKISPPNASAEETSSQALEEENFVANKICSPVHQKENENETTDRLFEKVVALEKESCVANKISSPVDQKENEATEKRLEKVSPLFLKKNNLSSDEILSQLLDEEDAVAHLIYPAPLKMKFSAADDISSLPWKKENPLADKISSRPLEKTNANDNLKQHVSWSNNVPPERTKISSQQLQKENTEDNVKQHANLSNNASSERKTSRVQSVIVKSLSKEKEPHTPCRADAKPLGDLMKNPKKRKKCPNKNWASKKRRRAQKGTNERPVFGSREGNSEAKRYVTGSQYRAEPHNAPYNGSLNRSGNERDRSPNKNWRSKERRRDQKNTSERPLIIIPAAPRNESLNKYRKERDRSPNKNWSSREGRRDRSTRNGSHVLKHASRCGSPKKKRTNMGTEGHGARFQELLRPYENKVTGLKERENRVPKSENQLLDIPTEVGLTKPINDNFENREIHVRETRSYGDQTNRICFQGYPNTAPIVDFQRCPELLPIDKPLWWGSFNIWNQKSFLLDGLMAHLSHQACDKVYEQACQLQRVLQVEMLPKSYIWPKSFLTSEATVKNIALYFFPSEISEQAFDHMLDNMMGEDLALRVSMESAELLIFASVDLPMEFWRFKGKHYLWGVFKGKQMATSHSHSFGAATHSWSPLSTQNAARAYVSN